MYDVDPPSASESDASGCDRLSHVRSDSSPRRHDCLGSDVALWTPTCPNGTLDATPPLARALGAPRRHLRFPYGRASCAGGGTKTTRSCRAAAALRADSAQRGLERGALRRPRRVASRQWRRRWRRCRPIDLGRRSSSWRRWRRGEQRLGRRSPVTPVGGVGGVSAPPCWSAAAVAVILFIGNVGGLRTKPLDRRKRPTDRIAGCAAGRATRSILGSSPAPTWRWVKMRRP
jgi:hypothetical protein